MYHFSEAKQGLFYLNKDDRIPPLDGQPAFLRFARQHGVATDLWRGEGIPVSAALREARLDWTVDVRPVLVPHRGTDATIEARNYRALVRPDTEDIMAVVTYNFHVAENAWVTSATERLSERLGMTKPLIAAVGFGRDHERTLFVGRLLVGEDQTLCLLAYNQHSEGAVRFQVVEVDHATGTVFVPASPYASTSLAHVGDMNERLRNLADPSPLALIQAPSDRDVTFVERYRADIAPKWEMLSDSLWTPRHTGSLIRLLFEDPADIKRRTTIDERAVEEEADRYPGPYLRNRMSDISDAASAYRRICHYLDHESEACEKGDFTKDRAERLALGAGAKLKQRAWAWIVENT